jgi:hypothetical protein
VFKKSSLNQMYRYAAFESFSVPSDFVLGLHLLFG